jgi:branched-chain amino acid transport system substrate-binding protein
MADPRRSPSAAKALERFKAEGYEPGAYALFTYAVVQAIAEGIRKAGSDDPKTVAGALENGEPVETVLGPVKFDSKGDIAHPMFDINVWKNGEYRPMIATK